MRRTLLWIVLGGGGLAIAILFFVAGGASVLYDEARRISGEVQSAATFFVQSITASDIQNKYQTLTSNTSRAARSARNRSASGEKVRILIVPGHQPGSGGAEFGSVRERDLVVDIAATLAALLAKNPHYDVMVARTKQEWHPVLQSYFDTNVAGIEDFRASQALLMNKYLAEGSILPAVDQVYHNTAPSLAALQLYGINLWTSEKAYDITLHLHLNDHAGRRGSRAGRYDGYAIYVPDHQYSNAEASKAIGEALAARLGAYHATSTLPKEDAGVVEDQELIAIGSNNSADSAALLIEYGYIYEPQFQTPSVRALAIADYAYATYLGLQDFFKDPVASAHGTLALPYPWETVVADEGASGAGIYALQTALRSLGRYPPRGKTFSACPISGTFGPCTRSALESYQREQGLEATGTLGPKTRAALVTDTVY